MADDDRTTSPLLVSVGYPLLYMSAMMLQIFTALTAFRLLEAEEWHAWRLPAAVAAFALPPLSDLVVAYYAWRTSGSMVNSYSIWVLVWMLLFLVVLGLGILRDRKRP
jgi:hypothetical protein